MLRDKKLKPITIYKILHSLTTALVIAVAVMFFKFMFDVELSIICVVLLLLLSLAGLYLQEKINQHE